MQLISAHPRDIDLDGPWLFWARPPAPELAGSLAALGQAVPVLVDFSPDRPRLVAGYSRAMALRGMKGATLEARPVSEPDPDCALYGLPLEIRFGLLYLASNAERQPDDAMLVAAARFFTARLSFAETLRLAGPGLKLAPKEKRARDLEAWLSLPEHCDALLRAGFVGLASAQELAALGPDLAVLEPYLQAVRWSRNSLRNFMSWLGEAALARGESLAGIVRRADLAVCLEAGLSPNDLTARLLARAKETRYPRLTGLTERFAALSGELRQGTRLRLSPSQGFESDAVHLEADIASRADLERLLADLALAAGRGQWEKLWSLVRDAEDEGGE